MNKKGFTLLELLIVIAISVILSLILIVVINPAETLRKARDSQRLADLGTLKTVLALYVTTVKSSDLDLDAAIVNHCLTDITAADGPVTLQAKISYSAQIADALCAPTAPGVLEGTDVATGATFWDGVGSDFCRYVGATGGDAVGGTGWVPVDLTKISGGSPIPGLPLDPTNSVATATAPVSTDLVYRYACQQKTTAVGKPAFVFELNAQLESTAFTVDNDVRTKDGGDTATLYETGTSTKLMSGTNY